MSDAVLITAIICATILMLVIIIAIACYIVAKYENTANFDTRELHHSRQVFEHPSDHICIDETGSLCYDAEMVRALEIVTTILDTK